MKRSQYKWTLPAEINARLGLQSWGAQRAIVEGKHLLLVLHAPPKTDSNERDHEVFYRTPEGKWLYKGLEHGERALNHFFEEYQKLLGELEKRYETAADIDGLFAVIDALIPLARASSNMKQALQSAREGIEGDLFIIDLRDRAVELARGFEILLADAKLALDYRIARSGEEQTRAAEVGNRAQHKLNLLAAIAFPLMTFSAIFGMNLKSGLENLPIFMFWVVFAVGLLVGLFLKGWVSKAQLKSKAPSAKPKAR
jgi:hypothetical protein